MPTPPRATEWFRGPGYAYAVDEDHFLSRIAVLVLGVAAISRLIRLMVYDGRYSAWSLVAGVTCLVVAATTIWIMTRFGHRHLVLAVDRSGIALGPGLSAYLRRLDIREFIAWPQISQVHLFRLDYAAEMHRYPLARHHVRITTIDGRQTERAMPSFAGFAALERALKPSPRACWSRTRRGSRTRSFLPPTAHSPTSRRPCGRWTLRRSPAGRPEGEGLRRGQPAWADDSSAEARRPTRTGTNERTRASAKAW
ncbi:MAG TPA: hypothetical protein VHN80_22615, partial [Kineosporiaceae bacterium]|nr:hypothetical protein [Kineosporiaceae bacterium]